MKEEEEKKRVKVSGQSFVRRGSARKVGECPALKLDGPPAVDRFSPPVKSIGCPVNLGDYGGEIRFFAAGLLVGDKSLLLIGSVGG